MDNRKQALTDMLAKVKAGGIPDTALVQCAFGHADKKFNGFRIGELIHWIMQPNDIRGMGAAMALHEAVLPGWVVNGMDQAANLAGDPWGVEVAYFDGPNPNNNRKAYSGHDYSNPARAWLIAIIKALIAEETE